MTVRLTPIESDSTPPQQIPAPPKPSGNRVTNPAAPARPVPAPAPSATSSETTAEGPSDVGPPSAADSRRALREAREHRRRIAWMCAAVVALCLALTIVMVILARYRPAASAPPVAATSSQSPTLSPSPTQSVAANASTVTRSAAAPIDRAVRSTIPSRGAPAPEGGNP